jgi:hypothetical protein
VKKWISVDFSFINQRRKEKSNIIQQMERSVLNISCVTGACLGMILDDDTVFLFVGNM